MMSRTRKDAAAQYRAAVKSSELRRLRDEFALAFLPHAINDAMRNYDHVCPTVVERAGRIAYEAADALLMARALDELV